MEFSVLIERRVLKQIQKLDQKVSSRIVEALAELGKGFSARLDIKKLKGYRNHYRIRIGDYRILFEVGEEKMIVVYAILPRERAYE